MKQGFETHEDVQRHKHDFLMVHAAVIPTRVLPAPHGSTIMPERARLDRIVNFTLHTEVAEVKAHPLPNILLKLVSWYGRITVAGFKSMSRFALMVSFRKSYSSSTGYSSSVQRLLTSYIAL